MERNGEIPSSYRRFLTGRRILGFDILEGETILEDNRGTETRLLPVNARILLGPSVPLPESTENLGADISPLNKNRFSALIYTALFDVFHKYRLDPVQRGQDLEEESTILNQAVNLYSRINCLEFTYPLTFIIAHANALVRGTSHHLVSYKNEYVATNLMLDEVVSRLGLPKGKKPPLILDACNVTQESIVRANIESPHFRVVYRKGVCGDDTRKDSGTIHFSR